jgi:hypothetical protein
VTGSSFEDGELQAAIDGSTETVPPEDGPTLEDRIALARTPTERRLYRSMVDTVSGLLERGTEVIDLKVADTALAEMAEAFTMF